MRSLLELLAGREQRHILYCLCQPAWLWGWAALAGTSTSGGCPASPGSREMLLPHQTKALHPLVWLCWGRKGFSAGCAQSAAVRLSSCGAFLNCCHFEEARRQEAAGRLLWHVQQLCRVLPCHVRSSRELWDGSRLCWGAAVLWQ